MGDPTFQGSEVAASILRQDGSTIMSVNVESWKVEINIHGGSSRVLYFANEGLAQLAVEWAYADTLEGLFKRADIERIQEDADPRSSAWKFGALYGKKIIYWRKESSGFVAVKNYFTAELDVFRRDVVG